MTSRKHVLSTLGSHLERGSDRAERERAAEARLAAHEPNLVPERGQLTPAKKRDLFIDYAKAADATVERVKAPADVPKAVSGFLAKHNLPAKATRAPAKALDAIPWDADPMLETRTGVATAATETSVTPAFAGIAETGTLMLTSGKEGPTTLNFLPENHIVVLYADQIAGSYEEAWSWLRRAADGETSGEGAAVMPRNVNFITGPSRSADIEQTLQLGAHGPRRLHIILVDERKERKGRKGKKG